MSLFSDIINSIGTDKSAAPPKPSVRPLSATSVRVTTVVSKPGSRPGLPAAPSPLNGIKRKAEDGSPKAHPEKAVRPNPTPGLASTLTKRPAAPPLHAPKPSNGKALPSPRPQLDTTRTTTKSGLTPPITPTSSAAKAPVKGSYADIMARAKQAQETKTQSQVGLIKHQATQREKVSKIAERRRQEEEKAKGAKDKSTLRTVPGKHDKSRSVSPAKKTDQPKLPKAARPPLHAPASAYKGTMGISSTRTKPPPRKRGRYDEYLGTDEEDVSDDMDGDGEDEEGDSGSDASSDMEADAFEVDEEESRTLRAARDEDAQELALENRLKREKEERRKKLMNLASKRK